MALVDTMNMQMRGLYHLPLMRQLGVMMGIAGIVAMSVAVVMWSQAPNYRMLYSNLAEQDVAEIADSLQKAEIPHRITDGAGVVMVDANYVHNARLQLASQGLPKGAGAGFEQLDEKSGFGVSQFMENARYQRALEGELARTISSIQSVRSARVHLAVPKQTAFIRNKKQVTASVTIDLLPGRHLEDGQVAAISHMVAASIPNLESDKVTVIDQKGRLLTSPSASDQMRLSATQFEYRQRLEEYYNKRIEDIISPIVGAGAVRAQVSTDVDFTVTEQTQESFNPDLPAIRSEQTVEEESKGGMSSAGGVPGSLSNQPPEAGENFSTETSVTQNGSVMRRATRNYELDKTVSHTKFGGGVVRRLSVAVVVDDRQTIDEDGEVERTPLTEEELERITGLIKEAVGFDAQRGDSVNVINASFTVPPEAEPLPEPSFFDNPVLWSTLKTLLAGGVILFLMFSVLRPVMRELAAKGQAVPMIQGQGVPGGMLEDQLTLSGGQQGMQMPGASNYDANLNTAKTMASQDPKRVAQVVNNWVATDG